MVEESNNEDPTPISKFELKRLNTTPLVATQKLLVDPCFNK